LKFGKSQVQLGAILSYVLIILNATYGLFLTPFIVGMVGDAEYGVYKTISAFTSSLMVLDLGLGGTMMRYIAKYRTDKEENKISNFAAMGVLQTAVIGFSVAVITFCLYFFIDEIYASGLTVTEIDKAKSLYVFLAVGIVVHIFENLLNGIIAGYNRFIFANGIKVVRLLARIVAVLIFLGLFQDVLTLAVIDLFITVILVLIELLYIRYSLELKIRLQCWDGKVFFESFKYTILLFIASIVNQVNSNFAVVAIGAGINSVAVSVYSMALLIFAMYEQMSTSISGVMLPTVTASLKNDDEKYTNTLNLIVKVGRIQFIMLGAVFAGFIVLGQDFIQLWLGNNYSDVYFLVLILLGPSLLELCVNVCLSILRAKNLLGFRTIVISATTVLNILITLVGLKYWGYYSAAIGTALSYLIGSVIVMGIYYYKKLGFNILGVYKRIFGKIWICILLSGISSYLSTIFIDGLVLRFVVGFLVFLGIYVSSLLLLGLNQYEKRIIFSKIKR